MQLISSYSIELKVPRYLRRCLFDTIEIYRSAVSFCINSFETVWDSLYLLDTLSQNSYANKLIHSTGTSCAMFTDFDKTFYKFPQGFRKSAVSQALSVLKTYHTNTSNSKYPTLNTNPNVMPFYYKNESVYKTEIKPEKCFKLKVYKDNDWKYIPLKFKKTDYDSLVKKQSLNNTKCKTTLQLQYERGKFFVKMFFETKVLFQKKKLSSQKILAIDLGINTDACCSIMNSSGTILGRKFIDFPRDKDYLNHTLNKIKRNQKTYKSSNNTGKLWRRFHNKTEQHSIKITKAIIEYAQQNNIDVIVLEHLDFRSRKSSYKSGDNSTKLQYWRCKTLIKRITHQAHLHGIRVSTVSPAGTSAEAFDGSGQVVRDKSNYSLCTLQSLNKNGKQKQYNTDLNASYNIGARYFLRLIRNFLKTKESLVLISEDERSNTVGKIPGLLEVKRSTLNTLLLTNSYLNSKGISLDSILSN